MGHRRIFRRVGDTLRSAITADQMDAPHNIVGAFSDDEQLMRLFYRVYELGRQDAKREIRNALNS